MQTEETRALVQAYYDALTTGNKEGILATLADDAVWDPPEGGDLSRVVGSQNLLHALAGPGITELFDFTQPFKLDVRSMIVDGDTAVVQQRLTATAKATGNAYDNQYCWVYTCSDGKITYMEEYANTLIAARAFGWDLDS